MDSAELYESMKVAAEREFKSGRKSKIIKAEADEMERAGFSASAPFHHLLASMVAELEAPKKPLPYPTVIIAPSGWTKDEIEQFLDEEFDRLHADDELPTPDDDYDWSCADQDPVEAI